MCQEAALAPAHVIQSSQEPPQNLQTTSPRLGMSQLKFIGNLFHLQNGASAAHRAPKVFHPHVFIFLFPNKLSPYFTVGMVPANPASDANCAQLLTASPGAGGFLRTCSL